MIARVTRPIAMRIAVTAHTKLTEIGNISVSFFDRRKIVAGVLADTLD